MLSAQFCAQDFVSFGRNSFIFVRLVPPCVSVFVFRWLSVASVPELPQKELADTIGLRKVLFQFTKSRSIFQIRP